MRLIDADKLKQHYAWWNDENKELFDTIVDMQPTVEPESAETLARLYGGNKVIKTATAKCSPADKFSFETGAKIAFERLFDSEEKEEPKYFNGKALCVYGELGFTAGKIYEFVNGQCLDDQKTLRPTCVKCKDLSWFNGVFIPLVE